MYLFFHLLDLKNTFLYIVQDFCVKTHVDHWGTDTFVNKKNGVIELRFE